MKIKYHKPETEIVELEATEEVRTVTWSCIDHKWHWKSSDDWIPDNYHGGNGGAC